ncbi:uncharacterized protein [Asterias amurensis]|uniref:uncharacterized protein isoform X2 n=1 Tax=Asterias amurensis TaxID=7602 RepID=UPI003AB3DFE4
MGTSPLSLLCVVGLLVLHRVGASHFRGGIITWRSLPDNPRSVEVTYRLAWKKDFIEQNFDVCTAEAIEDKTELFLGKRLYLNEDVVINDMSYICTDYNVAGDYAAGVQTYIIPVPDGVFAFDISIQSCCWVTLQNYPVPRNYQLNATVDLTPRANRGNQTNSSPTASIVPVQFVQQSCNHVIRIPVSDPDGDVVRCRFADPSRNECFKVCGALEASTLESSETECTLTYNGPNQVGWYGVTIMIEDFNRRRRNRPLSRVPLHFLIKVTASDENCHRPGFVNPTPDNGECLPAAVDQPKTIRLAARSENSHITGISTFGLPLGMEVTPLTSDPADPMTFYVDLQWTPPQSQRGPHHICFSVFDQKDDHEFASDQVCITVHVGARATHPVPELSRPHEGEEMVSIFNEEWEIQFDSSITQHATSEGAIVSIIKVEGNEPVHTVNLADETNVQFPLDEPSKVLFTTPGLVLEGSTEYMIHVQEGAVLSAVGCKSVSASHEWHFTTGRDLVLAASRLPPQEVRRQTVEPECFAGYMAIYVSKSWLSSVSSLIDPAGMHLNEPSCIGEDFNETHFVLGASHDMCGTVVTSETEDIQVVENIVYIPPQPDSLGSSITRDKNIEVHVECRLTGSRLAHVQFDPNVTTIIYHEVGYGTFNFQMRMYEDSAFQRKFKPINFPIDVDQSQRLYFEAKVVTNEDLSMFLDSCRATPTANPRDPTKYIFINKGCKVDDTVEFHYHPSSLRQRFSIEAFAFLGENLHGSVFVHCDLATCHAADLQSPCARGCQDSSVISRRDVSQSGSSSKAYPNTDGPIRIRTGDKVPWNPVPASSDYFNFSYVELPMLTATVVLLFVILIVLVRALKAMRRHKKDSPSSYPHRVDRLKLPSIRIPNE